MLLTTAVYFKRAGQSELNLKCRRSFFTFCSGKIKCVCVCACFYFGSVFLLFVGLSLYLTHCLFSLSAHLLYLSLSLSIFSSAPPFSSLSSSLHSHLLLLLLLLLCSFHALNFQHGLLSSLPAVLLSVRPYCSVSVERRPGCYQCPNVMPHGCGILTINNSVLTSSVQDRPGSQRESNLLSPSNEAQRGCK